MRTLLTRLRQQLFHRQSLNRQKSCLILMSDHGHGPITRRSFPREAFPRDDAQGYVSARCDSDAETYPCASSRGNASRGKDRRVIGPQPQPPINSYSVQYLLAVIASYNCLKCWHFPSEGLTGYDEAHAQFACRLIDHHIAILQMNASSQWTIIAHSSMITYMLDETVAGEAVYSVND